MAKTNSVYAPLETARVKIRALNHKIRQGIIDFIREKENPTVTQIMVKMKLEQTVTSQHLKILRDAGIVTGTRDGKEIHYSVNEDKMAELLENAGKI